MSPRPSRGARRATLVGVLLALAPTLTGCFTGARPTLAEGPAMSGDPAVDAVLSRLDQTRTRVFTAGYDILVRFGGADKQATVVQAGHAFSVEPGIYVGGRWGMRLEDIVIATASGPEALNDSDHSLVTVEA